MKTYTREQLEDISTYIKNKLSCRGVSFGVDLHDKSARVTFSGGIYEWEDGSYHDVPELANHEIPFG